ncbi:MAG: hypothetical protein OXI84_03345 [bacterium]|nr:hypothetical protein [bacterium]
MSDERIPIDRLLDLVEGTLPEDEAARLEATLDEADRREVAVQAAVRAVLGQLPGPELSDDERQRLRAAVRAELRVEEADPAPSGGRSVRRSWLARALPSAAAAATVVAVIAVAINLVGGTDSLQETPMAEVEAAATAEAAVVTAAPAPAAEASEEYADSAEPVATVTTIAMVEEAAAARAVEAEDAAPAAEAAAEAEMMMEEEAMAEAPAAELDAALADEAYEAVQMAAEAAAEPSDAALLGPGYVAFEVATDPPEDARAMLEMVEELIAVVEAAPVPVAELADLAGEEGLVCWQGAADLAGADGVILWMAPGLVDGVAGEAYLVVPGPEDRPGTGVLALFVYPDCRAVALRAVTDE